MAAEVSWEYFTSANIFSISLNSKLLPCLTSVFSPYVIWLYAKTECVGFSDQFRFLHLKKLGFRCSVFPLLACCFFVLFCFRSRGFWFLILASFVILPQFKPLGSRGSFRFDENCGRYVFWFVNPSPIHCGLKMLTVAMNGREQFQFAVRTPSCW